MAASKIGADTCMRWYATTVDWLTFPLSLICDLVAEASWSKKTAAGAKEKNRCFGVGVAAAVVTRTTMFEEGHQASSLMPRVPIIVRRPAAHL